MNRHHFISYSSADAQDFALRLCDELAQGPPPIPESLAICGEVGNRGGEGPRLGTIANVLIDQGRYEEAIQQAQEAASIATEIKGSRVGSYGNNILAHAHLYSGNLSGARAAVETALQYDEPGNNGDVLKDAGIVARVLRLFDAPAVVDSAGALKDVRAVAAGE